MLLLGGLLFYRLCLCTNHAWCDVLIQLQRSGSALQNIRQSVTRLYILRKDDRKMQEILKHLQERLETAKDMKNHFEKKADKFAKGSSVYRSLKEDERFADGLIRGLELAIETIKEK